METVRNQRKVAFGCLKSNKINRISPSTNQKYDYSPMNNIERERRIITKDVEIPNLNNKTTNRALLS